MQTPRRRSQIGASIVENSLIGLKTGGGAAHDAILKRLEALCERLLPPSMRASSFSSALSTASVLVLWTGRGEFDDAAVSNLEHGGWGLHVS
jgi:hypothetical protein